MRRKQKLCSLSVDRIVLNHLDQPLCQERMQTVLDLVNDKQCAVLQRLQPAADTGEKSLCSGRLLIHKELKVFHTAIRTEATGSDKRFSFALPATGESRMLCVFESAIDLLSYATMAQAGGLSWRSQHVRHPLPGI